MHLKNGDWVVVCDAGKYVVYENQGDTDRLDLRTVSFDEHENPPTREQGTDKPGRFAGPNAQRATSEGTDWHAQEEERFIEALSEKVDSWAASDPARRFVLVADPRSMGTMRKALKDQTSRQVEKMLTGDYAHSPVGVIEELITRS